MDTQHLDNFLTGLKSYLDAQADARNIYNQEVALEFNPMLQFFGIGENKFSDIIAYFLNPQEKHGQGSAFLKAFLAMEGLPCKTWENLNLETAEVFRESGVDGRRMDIYIRFPENNYGIGIEMKIWAGDQKDQLKDYHAWLEKKHGDQQCLFYWRPYDTAPGEHSLTKEQRDALVKANQFYEINHEEWTVALLNKWLSVCRAENVRTFLKQLLQFINHEINGERFMGQHDLIAEYLKNNPSSLKVAMQVIDAQKEISNLILNELAVNVKHYSWPAGIKNAESDLDPDDVYTGVYFEISDESIPFKIGFEWERTKLREGYFGLIKKADKTDNLGKDGLAKIFGKASSTNAWPWYKALESRQYNLNLTDLTGSGKEDFLKAIAEKIQFLLDGLKQAEPHSAQN